MSGIPIQPDPPFIDASSFFGMPMIGIHDPACDRGCSSVSRCSGRAVLHCQVCLEFLPDYGSWLDGITHLERPAGFAYFRDGQPVLAHQIVQTALLHPKSCRNFVAVATLEYCQS